MQIIEDGTSFLKRDFRNYLNNLLFYFMLTNKCSEQNQNNTALYINLFNLNI